MEEEHFFDTKEGRGRGELAMGAQPSHTRAIGALLVFQRRKGSTRGWGGWEGGCLCLWQMLSLPLSPEPLADLNEGQGPGLKESQ